MSDTDLNNKLTEAIFAVTRSIHGKIKLPSDLSQLTMTQFQALKFIDHNDKVSMSDLANYFRTSMPTATVLCEKLITLGAITREHSTEDRRIVTIKLTPNGKQLLEMAAQVRNAKMTMVLDHLSLKEKKLILQILQKLATNLEAVYA